jgi:hypothetical protein
LVEKLEKFWVDNEAAKLLHIIESHVRRSSGLVLVNADRFELISPAELKRDLIFDVQANCGLSAAVDARLLPLLRAGCLFGESLLLAGVSGLALGAIAAASWPSGGRWFAEEFVLRSRMW